MPPTAKTPNLLPIPARTAPGRCNGCGASIYWIEHPKTRRRHPVSLAHASAVAPTTETAGVGVSHFADCPEADFFRRKR